MVYKYRVGDRKYKNGKPEPPAARLLPLEPFYKPRVSFSCISCGTQRTQEEFLLTPSEDFVFTDKNNKRRVMMCTHCLVKMCEHIEEEYKSPYMVLYRMCAFTGFSYNDELAHKVFTEPAFYEDGKPVSEFLSKYELYFRAMQENDGGMGKSFMTYSTVPFDVIVKMQKDDIAGDTLSDQAKRDKNDIIEKFHYDPFDKEPALDRGRLYSDLLTLYDDAMATDLVRQRAAIEIVKSFYRIDCIGQTIQELQSNTQSMVENSKVLKELIDQKKKETDMVTAFSKDHGFAERYQMAKSKGAGTLSSIVRDGFENHFDRLAVNKFDIETSNAMKQVAEISAQSMLSQIQFTPEEFRTMVEDQAEEIRNLQSKVANLTEANRLLREKGIKQDLLEEYYSDLKKKGINDEEVIVEAVRNASPSTFYDKNGEEEK